jgi:hypothetical protein
MKQLIECQDPAVMRLAHPLRCAADTSGAVDIMKEFLGPKVLANMSKAFAQDKLTSEIVGDLFDIPDNRPLKTLLNVSNQMEGGTEVGNSYPTLLFLRHAMHPQPYFVIDDNLVEMLENTDIAEDVPVSSINLPYSRFYVEFGKERKSSLRVHNELSGAHCVEGAYLERGRNAIFGEGVFVLLTGSPLGKTSAMDDATHSLFLSLEDPSQSVRDALELSFRMGREVSLKNGLRITPSTYLDQTFESILFLVKALLYIGLPEARKQVNKDRSEWLKSTAALKSTAKKAKAEKRGRGLVDHILVSAPLPAPGSLPQAEGQRSVKTHWRRGHYRMHAHGPQFSLRKLLFIQPILVRSDAGEASVPQYKVT